MDDHAADGSDAVETGTPALPPVLQGALEEFRTWREARKKRYRFRPTPLFHYTDAVGLCGIVQTDTLWFTHSDHLNDPSEFHVSHDAAKCELNRAHERAISDGLASTFFSNILNGLETASLSIAKYVGSFSTCGNDLGQWRSYADNGRGFCLCLSKEVTTPSRLNKNPLKTPFVIRIKYKMPLAYKELEAGINIVGSLLARESVRAACKRDLTTFLTCLSLDLTHWIYFICIAFKHPAYASEREIRLLLINDATSLQPYVKTRVRNGNLIPYIPWPFDPSL